MIEDKDECGTIITREMIAMMLNKNIDLENRAKIMVSILSGDEIDDPMMQAFAESLRIGFEKTNSIRRKSIENRRKRQTEYQRKNRYPSTSTDVDERQSTTPDVDRRQSTFDNVDRRQSITPDVDRRQSTVSKRSSTHYGKAYAKAYANANNNIYPLNPPEGEVNESTNLDPQAQDASALAEEIERTEAFAHMRVSRRKLLRALRPVLQKNTAAEILAGIERWTLAWAAEGWRYAPGSISQWIADGKFLQEPRAVEESARPDEEIGVKEIV